jgi:chromosome segregation ATPase
LQVADFVGDGEQKARKARQYTYAVPYRSDAKKKITVETSLSAQQVGSTIDNSTDSNFSDMSSHDESSDDEVCMSKYSGLEQVFTGTDLLLSALKFQDENSENDTPTSLAAPPMLGIGASQGSPQSAMMSGGVSDSPLNPVSWTISRIQASKAASGKEPTPIKPILVAKRRQHPDATSGDGAVKGNDKGGQVILSLPPKGSRGQQLAPLQDLGRVSDEGEPCVAGGDESGLLGQNVSLKMDICSSKGDAASKEELYVTAKASLKVQEAQLLEQKSEISRLMVLLADYKRELGLAREREGMTKGESGGGAEASGLESASTKIRLLQTQLDEALAQISQKNIVITEMESQIRKLDANVVSSGAELSRCRVRLEEKGMELEGKNQENIHLKEKFDIAHREMALLENDMKECEAQNKRLEQDVQKLQKQCKSVQKDLDEERLRADSEVERQREKATELQGRISDLQGQVSSLSSKFQESQETVLEISEERDRLLLETLHAEVQGNQHTQQNAQELQEAKQSALQAMQRVLILEEGAAKLEKQCRHLGEMLAQREKELEESLTRQRAVERQMNAIEDELQAATSQNRHLQERLLSCEARANKVQDESRRQINEMDVLLQRERTLSEARGQEQLDGRPEFAELEERNRVLLDRIAHLTADHKASADTLTAELQYANARILALEKGEIVKARDLQAASDHIDLRTSERDKLAEQMHLLQERLSKTESELNIAQCSLLETQEALQNERDASTRMVQGLEAKCASASELLETARACQQEEMQMQLECEKQKNEQRIAASEVKNRELQLESLLALQSAEDAVVDLQTQLTASRAETNSLQQMKQESEAENAVLRADFDKALSSTKDTIAQLKDMCARLETTLQTKQTALQTVREEVQTLQLTNGELVESLARLRAECVHMNEAHERIKLQEKEWELERQQWRKERYELEAQIDERAQEKEMERQAEEERKRESEEARQRLLQQIEEAKAVSGGWGGGAEGGEADIAFCNILLGQEEMLRKGLSISESALLDIIEQRFPLLGFHQRERQKHRSQKQECVGKVSKVDCKLVRVFILLVCLSYFAQRSDLSYLT